MHTSDTVPEGMTKHQPVTFEAFISLKAAACPHKVPTDLGSYPRQEMGGTLWASVGAEQTQGWMLVQILSTRRRMTQRSRDHCGDETGRSLWSCAQDHLGDSSLARLGQR